MKPKIVDDVLLSRRFVLAASSTMIGGAILNTVSNAIGPKPIPDPTKSIGRGSSKLGSRAVSEQLNRYVNRPTPSGESMTPLQDLVGIITPSDLHYERHHGGIPDIALENYELLIHGMVSSAKKFTIADLKRFPQRSRICFIECSGNGYHGYYKKNITEELSAQQLDGLISTSEWTGVMLSTLFREVGVKSGAKWFLAEGSDAAVMTRSIPIGKAWDDAMIVFGQNGEAIRPEQGYPARLLLPGWEGNTSVKWIRRIELSDKPFMTREETSKYSDPLPDCTARLFSFVMDAKSLITFPSFPYALPQKGWWEIQGYAWSGHGKIVQVEVSTDGGINWRNAELQEPILSKCQTRFRIPWHWNGERSILMSRALDETGYMQPSYAQLESVRGKGTSYHFNHIRAWKVEPDGRVLLGLNEMI
ncbi:MAG: sulfite dehydrogenase [Saprospiraceae bacterium]|nr:sulfite dehydrogenase [Saprospiraceae bacterium]